MALIAPVVSIKIDDPAVAGRIVRNYHHYGRNWEFDDDPDSHLEPKWWLGGVSYMRSMRAIAPMAIVNWADMPSLSGGQWQVEVGEGYWERSRPAITKPRVQFYHYHRAQAGEMGEICSTYDVPPALHFAFLRYGPVDGETAAPRMEIDFLGDGEGYCYALWLPPPGEAVALDDSAQHKPALYRWLPGDWDGLKKIGEFQGLGGSGYYLGPGARIEHLRIEQIGEYLKVDLSNAGEDWIIPLGDHPLVRGPVRVKFFGGAAMFNVQPLDWMRSVWHRWVQNDDDEWVVQWSPTEQAGWIKTNPFALPQDYLMIPDWMNGGPGVASYPQVVAEIPTGTRITVLENDDGGRGTRPQINFIQQENMERRPVLFRVQQWNVPVRTAVDRDATVVNPNRVSWHRDNEWRNAHFTAEFDDPAELSSLPAFGEAEFAIAADTGGEAPTPTTRIIGYLDGAHARRAGGRYQGEIVPTLRAADHPAMRLAGRKFMRHMCSFEGWHAAEIFVCVLKSWGVRDDYINVDAAVTHLPLTMPENDPPWEEAWGWEHDYGGIEAFDKLFRDFFGLQWGWNESGYFLRQRPSWSSGDAVDWTLDHDTADMDQIVRVIDVERATAESRNYVMVMAGQSGGFWYDPDSLDDPDNDRYRGDDAWAIDGQAENHDQASAMAYHKLRRLREFDLALEIGPMEKLDLAPDNFMAVHAGMTDFFPDGSVFRLVDEDGDAEGRESPKVEVTYTAGVVWFAE